MEGLISPLKIFAKKLHPSVQQRGQPLKEFYLTLQIVVKKTFVKNTVQQI